MKFKANIITIVLLFVTIVSYSQIDSLENRKIYSWKLNSYDYGLERQTIDTSLTSFQNFNPLLRNKIVPNYLGNLGTAAQPKIYYDRRKFNTGFVFSKPYGIYFNQPREQKYFNTKSPFTLVKYSNGGPKEESEQVIGVLHTQNINKNLNFGIDYTQISSDGRYQNQEVKINSLTVFSSYKNKGYRLHTNIGFDKVRAQENGGIDSLQFVGDDDYSNRKNIPVRLNEAGSKVSNSHIYLAQEYSFGRTIQQVKVRGKVNSESPVDLKNIRGHNKGNKLQGTNVQKKDSKDRMNPNNLRSKNDSISSNNTKISDLIIDSTSINEDLDFVNVDNFENQNDSIVTDSTQVNSVPAIDSTYLDKEFDTLNVFRSSGFSISHELYYTKDKRNFFDDDIEESYYNDKDIFFDSTRTNEEAIQRQLTNKLSLNYKYSNKFSVQLSFSNEQLKYKYDIRSDTLSIDSIVTSSLDTNLRYTTKSDTLKQYSNNNLSIYLKSLIFNKILVKGYAEYYISGYKKEDSKLDLKFAYILWDDTELGLEGLYSNKRPNYFYENYSSNNFSWDNDNLRKIVEWDVGFAIRSKKYRLNAKVSYGQISNHLYLDTTAYVNQYRDQINLMVGDISKSFSLGPIQSITRFVYQESTNDSILNLPEYSLYQSLYYERLSTFASTNGKLLWQVGVDYRYVSSYSADGYMPPLGLFYRQFGHVLKDYHRFDLFVNLNIKRARIYLKYSLLNSAINENYYFSGPYYPEPEPLFKFGLAWTFYD